LETTLEINKEVIASLMSAANMGDVLKKINDETTYLKKRLKQIQKDSEMAHTKILLLEQINADYKMKEHMITRTLEE
jgi:hypothetical protein